MEFVRDTLCRMIGHYGQGVVDEPRRCESLLRDLCPHNKREVNLLMSAQREGVPGDLRGSSVTAAPTAVIDRLVRKLEHDLGLSKDAARWAVESWALALGVVSRESIAIPVVELASDPLPPPRPPPRSAVPPPPLPMKAVEIVAKPPPAPRRNPLPPVPEREELPERPKLHRPDTPAPAPSIRMHALKMLLLYVPLTAVSFGVLALVSGNRRFDIGPLILIPGVLAIFGPFAVLGYVIQWIVGVRIVDDSDPKEQRKDES